MKQFATLRSLQTHLSSCPFTITPCFGGARSWRGDKAEPYLPKITTLFRLYFLSAFSLVIFAIFKRFCHFLFCRNAGFRFSSRIERAAQHKAPRATGGSVCHQPGIQMNRLSFMIACALQNLSLLSLHALKSGRLSRPSVFPMSFPLYPAVAALLLLLPPLFVSSSRIEAPRLSPVPLSHFVFKWINAFSFSNSSHLLPCQQLSTPSLRLLHPETP